MTARMNKAKASTVTNAHITMWLLMIGLLLLIVLLLRLGASEDGTKTDFEAAAGIPTTSISEPNSAEAAAASSKVYATTREGVTATASGQYFYVPQSSTETTTFDLYKNNSGIAQYINNAPSTSSDIAIATDVARINTANIAAIQVTPTSISAAEAKKVAAPLIKSLPNEQLVHAGDDSMFLKDDETTTPTNTEANTEEVGGADRG